jgi:hypothetical protein
LAAVACIRNVHLTPAAATCALEALTATALVSPDDPVPVGAPLPASLPAKDSHQTGFHAKTIIADLQFTVNLRRGHAQSLAMNTLPRPP